MAGRPTGRAPPTSPSNITQGATTSQPRETIQPHKASQPASSSHPVTTSQKPTIPTGQKASQRSHTKTTSQEVSPPTCPENYPAPTEGMWPPKPMTPHLGKRTAERRPAKASQKAARKNLASSCQGPSPGCLAGETGQPLPLWLRTGDGRLLFPRAGSGQPPALPKGLPKGQRPGSQGGQGETRKRGGCLAGKGTAEALGKELERSRGLAAWLERGRPRLLARERPESGWQRPETPTQELPAPDSAASYRHYFSFSLLAAWLPVYLAGRARPRR